MKDYYISQQEYVNDELDLLDLRLEYILIKRQNLFESKLGAAKDNKPFGTDEANNKKALQRSLDELKLRINEKHIAIKSKLSVSCRRGFSCYLLEVYNRFQLSTFEKECFIICIAPQMNSDYLNIFEKLQNGIKLPTVLLLTELLCNSQESKLKAVELLESQTSFTRFIVKINKNKSMSYNLWELEIKLQIVKYIFNQNNFSKASYYSVFFGGRELYNSKLSDEGESNLADILYDDEIQSKLENILLIKQSMVFVLSGPTNSGKRFHIKHIAKKNNKMLFILNMNDIISDNDFSSKISLVFGQVLLYEGWVLLYNCDSLFDDSNKTKLALVEETMMGINNPVFICGNEISNDISIDGKEVFFTEVKLPSSKISKSLWEHYSKAYNVESNDFSQILCKYKLTPVQIKNAFIIANNMAISEGNEKITYNYLNEATKQFNKNKLVGKVQQKSFDYTLKDLILDKEQTKKISELCGHVKYRYKVYEQWGFNKKFKYGIGLSVLFTGYPGTGKTMTAQAVAKELNLDLYKIDISQVISKYIGETEKNLSQIFNEAERTNVVLFFDEADAIFGKRSEVKDAHDRYANVETSFLLQRIEEYDGITILATNFDQNIDTAFERRFSFKINFPFPNADLRKRLWKSMLPVSAPIEDNIDLDFLADTYEFVGGNIKNIVINAAFKAAILNEKIGMKHLFSAIKDEMEKTNKIFMKNSMREYEDLFEYL